MKQISPFLRERFPDCRIRLNTNGLGDLIYGRSTAGEVCRLADSISISLNMPDADSYEAVVHPVYGKKRLPPCCSLPGTVKRFWVTSALP